MTAPTAPNALSLARINPTTVPAARCHCCDHGLMYRDHPASEFTTCDTCGTGGMAHVAVDETDYSWESLDAMDVSRDVIF